MGGTGCGPSRQLQAGGRQPAQERLACPVVTSFLLAALGVREWKETLT